MTSRKCLPPPRATTSSLPWSPIRWGYGKIDAAAGIEYIKRATAVNSIESDEPAAESNLWFDIIGRSYNSKPTAPGIYIHSGKKYIIK